jgi:hypothetical protein
MARPKTEHKSFKLRLPPAMYDQLDKAAAEADRSINSEMLYRLGRTLDPRWAEYIAALDERDRLRREIVEQALSNPRTQEWFDTVVLPQLPAMEERKRQADIAETERKLAKLKAASKDVGPKPTDDAK